MLEFVFVFLDCTLKSAIDAIYSLCDTIGIRTFKKYLPISLTDHGSEIKTLGI